jgi:hypothetical protein
MLTHWTENHISSIQEGGVITYYGWDERNDDILVFSQNKEDVINALETYYAQLKRRKDDTRTVVSREPKNRKK